MVKFQIPLQRQDLHSVNSLAELRQVRKQGPVLKKQEAQRETAYVLKERVDSWMSVAKSYDQSGADYAQHRKGLVVLDKAQVPMGNGKTTFYGDLSGEVETLPDPRDGFQKANLIVENAKLTYERSGESEVYEEVVGGHKTQLVIDNRLGTLTYQAG